MRLPLLRGGAIGSTPDFGSGYPGSSPGPGANPYLTADQLTTGWLTGGVVFGASSVCRVFTDTWRPDYDAFFYCQLCRRARRLYLFRSEYILDMERVIVVETPQLGHATYLFSQPASIKEFFAIYSSVTKDDIRQNRDNVAERLGFLARPIHGVNPRVWLKELKARLGEVVDYAEAVD